MNFLDKFSNPEKCNFNNLIINNAKNSTIKLMKIEKDRVAGYLINSLGSAFNTV